jgi:fumarate hydratase class II
MNFPINGVESRMLPYKVIYAMYLIKKVCAEYYAESQERNAKWRGVRAAIGQAANEVMAGGENDDQFPLVIYQTGSGTQKNMK